MGVLASGSKADTKSRSERKSSALGRDGTGLGAGGVGLKFPTTESRDVGRRQRQITRCCSGCSAPNELCTCRWRRVHAAAGTSRVGVVLRCGSLAIDNSRGPLVRQTRCDLRHG